MSDIVIMGRTGGVSKSGSLFKHVRMDPMTEAIQVLDYPDHEINGGSHYFVTSYADLAINHVLQLTWVMPNTTNWIHFRFSLSVENETLWQIYEDVTVVTPLSNAIVIHNANRNSTNTTDTTMKFEDHADTAAANGKVSVAAATLIKSGILGAGRAGGAVSKDEKTILKQGSTYSLRATATAAGYINFDMEWFEHISKGVEQS